MSEDQDPVNRRDFIAKSVAVAGALGAAKELLGKPGRSAATSGKVLGANDRIQIGIIGVGGEIAWPRPTRAGDTLQVESEILSITPSRSKPNQAMVTIRITTLNQDRDPVYIFTAKVLVTKREPV